MNKLIYKIYTSANTRFIKYYRKNRIKNTIANTLSIGHIDSLELLELIKSESEINVIYDIGANVGSWSILANAIFPNAKIIAFEPLSTHIQEFEQETKLLKQVKLVPFALGQKQEKSIINVSSFSDASSLMSSTEALKNEYNITETEQIEIQVLRLDEVQIGGQK